MFRHRSKNIEPREKQVLFAREIESLKKEKEALESTLPFQEDDLYLISLQRLDVIKAQMDYYYCEANRVGERGANIYGSAEISARPENATV